MLSQVKNGFLLSAILAVALGFWIAAPVQATPTLPSDVVYIDGQPVITAPEDPAATSEYFPAFAPAPGGIIGGVDFVEPGTTGSAPILSDQIWIQPNPAADGALYFYFSSDPFVTGQTDRPTTVPLLATLVEDGTPQDVTPYFGVTAYRLIQVQSDVQDVPEPGTLALLGVGAIGLMGYVWRRRR